MNKPEFLICENRTCGKPIFPDNSIVHLDKKLRVDAESCTYATLACSLVCMMQILAEFVQQEYMTNSYRIDSLLAKNIKLEKDISNLSRDLSIEMEKNK